MNLEDNMSLVLSSALFTRCSLFDIYKGVHTSYHMLLSLLLPRFR